MTIKRESHQEVSAVAASPPKTVLVLLIPQATAALVATSATMTVFELLKQWLFPPATIWRSHLLTICFTGCLAFMVSQVVLRKLRAELLREGEAQRMAHRQAEVFINAVPSILIGLNYESRV